ncbi:MAG: hypothetical protein J0M08_12330 [Bacteroidetes bacterium]|nr:hypothetical protein [Bacteroidota bacterium]
MKKVKIISLLACLASCNNAVVLAQQAEANHSKLKLSSVGVSTTHGNIKSDGGYNSIIHRTGKSKELEKLDSSFNQLNDNYDYKVSSFGIEFGFHPYSKKLNTFNKNKLIFVGLNIGSEGGNCSLNLNRRGQLINDGDTTTHIGVNYHEFIRTLGLDFKFVHTLPINEKLKIYYGIGGGITKSIGGHTSRVQDTTVYIGTEPLETSESGMSAHLYKHSPLIRLQAYVPLGLAYQLAKTKPIFKNITLFAEGRITGGIAYRGSNSFMITLSGNMNYSFGVRYNLFKGA